MGAALNIVYQSPAELGNYHADHEPANVDHQEEEDCCCSASLETNHPAGLRIVNRPPKNNDHHHHYHHHQHQEHQKQDQKPKTCQPLACCKRKSQQVRESLAELNILKNQASLCQSQANVQKAHLTELRRSLAAHQEEVARYKALVNQLQREKKELLTTSTYPAAIRRPNSV